MTSLFLLNALLKFIPWIFLAIIFAIIIFIYQKRHNLEGETIIRRLKILIIAAIVFRIFYAILETVGQYYAWRGSLIGKTLIDIPISKSALGFGFDKILFSLFDYSHGYFIFYAVSRFWLNIIISVAAASVFYIFLIILKKYQERFFEKGEVELGFLVALILTWPNIVIFVPLVFLAVVLISICKGIFLKEAYTTLGAPFILAGILTALFGVWLINYFNLGVLKI